MDRQTDKVKPVYPPFNFVGGIIIYLQNDATMQVTNLPPDGGPEVYACLLDSLKFISDDKGLNWEHG